jgi:hypothetical protein
LKLSEEILVACDTDNLGCGGGFLDSTSDFLKATGTGPETADPYSSADGTTGNCSDAAPGWQRGAYRIGDWASVAASTAAIKSALIAHGPLMAGMVIYADFLSYKSGVYSHVDGEVEGGHAVVIIGYDDVQQCFLAKNSFGTGWGENGFFQISYNDGGCMFQQEVIAYSSADVTTLNLEIASPANQAPAFGSVSVTGAAGVTTSSVVVTGVEVRVDDGAWHAAAGTTTWSYTLDGDSLSRGSHILAARAMDSTGNSASAAITITHAPPGAPTLSATAVSSTAIRWSWTSSGTVTTFDFYYSTGSLRAALSGSASFYLETSLSTSTSYSRYVVAQNSAGQAQSSTVTVATPALSSFIMGTGSTTLSGAAGAALNIPADLLGPTTSWLVSEDPVHNPLTDLAVVLISSAQAAIPSGLSGSAAAITEFIVAVNNARSTATFASPVTVSVPYPDANDDGIVDGTNPPVWANTLQLYVLNERSAAWELVSGSTVDMVHHLVTGQMSHLSIFTALGTPASIAADLGAVHVYPIPYHPNGGDPNRGRPYVAGDLTTGIVFANLPNTVTIEIYAITGRRVARLDTAASSGKVQWNVQNNSGQDVASGGYIAVISSPGCGTITRKLIIVR